MEKKETIKTGFEKYFDEFDKNYKKHYHEKQEVIPILLNLFEENEEDIYIVNTLDKEIHKLQVEISDKLCEKLNEEQKELLDQLRSCISIETGKLVEKAFIYGFCLGQSLKDESKEYINPNI